MWAFGCIFAELFTKHPIFFYSKDQITQQVSLIFEALYDKNNKDLISAYNNLPGFNKTLRNSSSIGLKKFLIKVFKLQLDPDAFDLLEKLLQMNPAKRISAKEALEHVKLY